MVPERVRLAYRSAVERHISAAHLHDRAAVLFEYLDRPKAAERERLLAETERERVGEARRRHAHWL